MRPVMLFLIGLFLTGCAEAVGENVSAPVEAKSGVFTAYNALPEQTDDTPEITASGKRVKEGIVANNCLPFGTKIAVKWGAVFIRYFVLVAILVAATKLILDALKVL